VLHILWDLDGTLIDSREEIISCVKSAIEASGELVSNLEKPLRVGPTIDVMLRDAFAKDKVDEEKINEIIRLYRIRYDNSKFENTRKFDGSERILSDTLNFTHHIVTNKPDLPTKRIIEKLGWSKFISSIDTPYSQNECSANKLYKRDKVHIFADIIKRYENKKSLLQKYRRYQVKQA